MTHPTMYALAAIVPSKEGGMMSVVRILSEDEYNRYDACLQELTMYSKDERLFDIVEDSYQELRNALEKHLIDYSYNNEIGVPIFERISSDLNRLTLNLLSTIRTYLDHTETRLKRQSKKSLQAVDEFKKLTGEAFDSHFAYRFTEKLRNYAQHCGMPTGTISITSSVSKADTLSVLLHSQSLLQNFDSWGALLKSELKNGAADFDLMPLLAQKVELLREINQDINTQPLKLLVVPSNELVKIISEIQKKLPNSSPHLLKADGDDDNIQATIIHFPLDIITRVTGVLFSEGTKYSSSIRTGGSLLIE